MPSTETVHKLNERATFKLAEIARQGAEIGYDHAEIVATRTLLEKATQYVQR